MTEYREAEDSWLSDDKEVTVCFTGEVPFMSLFERKLVWGILRSLMCRGGAGGSQVETKGNEDGWE